MSRRNALPLDMTPEDWARATFVAVCQSLGYEQRSELMRDVLSVAFLADDLLCGGSIDLMECFEIADGVSNPEDFSDAVQRYIISEVEELHSIACQLEDEYEEDDNEEE